MTERSGIDCHGAIERNDLEGVLVYCKAGGQLERADSDGCTPLHIASAGGNLAIVQALLAHGANVNAQSRIGASKQRLPTDFTKSRQLPRSHVTCLASANTTATSRPLTTNDNAGHTPLHLACRYGHTSVALALLIKGCAIDAVDSEGNTPLHKAASNNHAALCKELVRRGADLARANASGFTALHWAAYKVKGAAVTSCCAWRQQKRQLRHRRHLCALR